MSFFHSLTPQQQRLALDYRGPDSLMPPLPRVKLLMFDKRTQRLTITVPVDSSLVFTFTAITDPYIEGEYPLTLQQAQLLVPWLDVSGYDCFVAGY